MRSCLLVFLIIIFVLFLPVYLFTINFADVMTPAFIKQELQETGLVAKLSQSLPAELADSVESDGDINQQAHSKAIAKIPNELISSTIQSNVDSNLKALTDPSATELKFDISSITSSIPAELKTSMSQSGQAELKDSYTYKIPTEIRLYRFITNNLAMIKIIGYAGFAFLLLLIFIAAEAWQTKLRATSLALLVPGFTIFVPFFLLRFLPISLPNMDGTPEILSVMANETFNVVKIDIANRYLIQAVILLVLAFMFFIISLFLPKPTPEQPAPVQPAKNLA